MGILANENAISSGGYTINNSLRFRASATAYLTRTWGTATNQNIWTYSMWVKRGKLATDQWLTTQMSTTTNEVAFRFTSSDTLEWFYQNTGATLDLITTQVFRDPSAWYHLVFVYDSTQATASNRARIYVNGNQITSFTTANYPALNGTINFNNGGSVDIGRVNPTFIAGGSYYDGLMAETIFVDGQALTPSSFGQTDNLTGAWSAKAYTGTYGNNGFYLKFSDIATTSGSNVGLGKDFSGNGNYWNTNNISVTSGATYDAMIDSPTLSSSGTRPVGNYPTINPLNIDTSAATSPMTYSAGNLQANSASGTYNRAWAVTMAIPSNATGKYYWEASVDFVFNFESFGLTSTPTYLRIDSGNTGSYAYNSQAVLWTPSGSSSFGGVWSANDIIGMAYDASTRILTFYKNNVSQGTTTLAAGVDYFPMYYSANTATSYNTYINFGQRPFVYTPPTGYVALCTTNLPDSTVKKGNIYMDATLYTGNGGTQSITNATGFKPDLVWSKGRSQASGNHLLTDSVRGTTKSLMSNDTGAEGTRGVSAFNSNGFAYIYPNEGGDGNSNGNTYVAWQWQAGQGTTSSNTSGSVTSTVSVNATAGFSVVTWTCPASGNFTIGHGLGVTPAMMIMKSRSSATAWGVWHQSYTNTSAYYQKLNTTDAQINSTTVWANTAPTSTVWSMGTNILFNANDTCVAYCFAQIAGFSKFGSYTGNGSADGTFVYTGFSPKYIMIKCTNTAGTSWLVYDTARNTYNVAGNILLPDSSGAELTGYNIDFLSNGFKCRLGTNDPNYSGRSYIYAAFASNPFKNSLAQ